MVFSEAYVRANEAGAGADTARCLHQSGSTHRKASKYGDLGLRGPTHREGHKRLSLGDRTIISYLYGVRVRELAVGLEWLER
jgi:hypothetical protein